MAKERIQKLNKTTAHIQLTERDGEILLFLLETRFLKREQIEKLFFSVNGILTPTSEAKANRRLKKLTDAGYVDRLFKPVAVGKPQAVYTLGKRGFEVLSSALGKDPKQLGFKKKNKNVQFLFLNHSLAISEFRINLEFLLESDPDASLLFWKPESRVLSDKVVDPTGKQKYLPVTPDAFFGIQTIQGKSYFFLEMDMGTETLRRFTRKITAYREYWKSGRYTKRYGYNHFRVITVCGSEKRLVNLRITARKAGAKNMFLFALQSEVSANGFYTS